MKTSVFVAALALSAGAASAQYQVPASAVHATPLDEAGGLRGGLEVVYSSIPGPYVSISGGLNTLLTDDFVTTLTEPDLLHSIRFVGGVTDIASGNNVVGIRLLDLANDPVADFTVNLPQAGNFIWTITLAGSGLQTPTAGTFELSSGTETTTVNWFNTSSAPVIGMNVPSETQTYRTFEMTVPAPGSVALVGAAGLVAWRRRRS